MNKLYILFAIITSLLISGCGGGGGGGGAATAAVAAGLPVAQAQAQASTMNTSVVNSANRAFSFLTSSPSASVSKINQGNDAALIQNTLSKAFKTQFKAVGNVRKSSNFVVSEQNNVYTVQESSGNDFDITLTLRYRDINGATIPGAQAETANSVEVSFAGFEVIDGVRLNYQGVNYTFTKAGNDLTLTGGGAFSTSTGLSFTLNSNNVILDGATLLPKSGSTVLTGTDGDSNVTVTSNFQANGAPVVTVQEEGAIVSSTAVPLQTVSLNNGTLSFQSNSAVIRHPYIGDMLDGKTKTYVGSLTVGNQTVPVNMTIQKTSSVIKVCGVNARKMFFAAATTQGSFISEEYIAEDTSGNVWDMGSSDQLPGNCNAIGLDYPSNLTVGTNFNTTDYSDNTTSSFSVTGVNETQGSFNNLVKIQGSNFGINLTEYLSTQYGSVVVTATGTVQGQAVNLQISRQL